MKQYLKFLNPTQQQPIPGQKMVKNNAGGYSFTISDKERLERFILLGSDDGTYYATEDKLTFDNATFAIDYIKRDSLEALNVLLSVTSEHRAPKYNAILFVYALIITFSDDTVRKQAYDNIADICHTPTHLFQLLTYLKPLRGWSRGLRNGVAKWYLSRSNDKLAYQLVKYRSRSGYTHRDVLRLCHAKTDEPTKNNILKYAVGKMKSTEGLIHPQINAFEFMQDKELDWTGTSLTYILDTIKTVGMTWEMIPTERLNNTEVLKAILDEMPYTALLRNLNRYSYNNLTDGMTPIVATICAKLRNPINAHPVNIVNSMIGYRNGQGDKGCKVWVPNQHILDALHDAYEIATATLTPTNKRILIGVDTSGSMSIPVSGMQMSAGHLSMVLAQTILKSEPKAEAVCFDTCIHHYPFGKRSSLDEVLNHQLSGGGTSCEAPLGYAIANNKVYDAIIILTDNETWAGKTHVYNDWLAYCKHVNTQTKVVEIALTSTPHTNFPPNKDILRIVGFDSSVISVLQSFLGSTDMG